MSPEHDWPIVDLKSYDWEHPAAVKLHRALTEAYGAKWTAMQRRVESAGIGWTKVKGESMVPEDVWHGVLEAAARKGVTRRLIDGVIKDPDIEGHAHAIASLALLSPGHSLRDWPPGRSPFPGLQAFTKDYAPVYCGRDAEVRALVDEIRAMRERRFLAVIGASGCGKSSMVRAGVVPALEAEGWLTVTCRPAEARKDPFLSLAMGLRELFHGLGLAADLDGLEAELRHKNLPAMLNRLGMARQRGIQPAELLLFVDQLEELFTQVLPAPDGGERRALDFMELLEEAADTPGLRVVVTVRDDMMAAYLSHRPLADLMQHRQYLVHPTGPLALLEMIEPAAAVVAGLRVDAALREVLFNDFGQASAGLPLLAFVLAEMYERADEPGHLKLAAYEAMGRLDGALNSRAEAALEELQKSGLAPLERDQLKTLFEGVFSKLVGVDRQGLASRERRALADLPADQPSRDLVKAMTDARLLVTSGEREGHPAGALDKAPTVVIELAHERLLDAWDRLTSLVDARRDLYLLLRRLREDAHEWRLLRGQERLRLRGQKQQSDVLLWSHERLANVPAMLDQLQPRLTVTECAFVIPEWVRLVKRLQDINLPHRERLKIGDRLEVIGGARGDPRPGVGLDEKGLLPDVLADGYWCRVEPGEVVLEDEHDRQTVKDGFWIGRYPVTWIQYQAFLQHAKGHTSARWWIGLQRKVPVEYPSHFVMNRPAVAVSWYDAVAYCRWLSWMLWPDKTHTLRLPTEQEWQLAAGGGSKERPYPWLGNWDGRRANTREASLCQTSAVGLYPAGVASCGALDMAGNVWEWGLNEEKNPNRVGTSGSAARVVRGGSWNYDHVYARASFRSGAHPVDRYDSIGFRLVVSSPNSPEPLAASAA